MTWHLPMVGLGLSIATGACLFYSPRRCATADRWLAFFASVGGGLGISACLYFLLRISTSHAPRFVLAVDVIGVVAAGIVLWCARCNSRPPSTDQTVRQGRFMRYVLSIALGLIVVSTVACVVFANRHRPLGGWDAWAMWNLKAKFLWQPTDVWKAMFLPPLQHQDYPLLLPLTVARLWAYQGSATAFVPAALCVVWPLVIVGVVVAALSLLAGPVHAIAAAILMLSMGYFVNEAASQYADLPLSMYMVSALCLAAVYRRQPRDWPMLGIAGLLTGCAAWTKNEGILFMVAILVALTVTACFSGGLAALRQQLKYFLYGLLPMAGIVLLFKLRYAAANELLNEQTWGAMIAKCTDLARHRQLLGWTYQSLTHRFDAPMMVLMLLLAGCVGLRRRGQGLAAGLFVIITLTIVAGGYYVIYLITLDDLTWHLQTSHDRLLIQLWPCAVLGLFLILRPVEERSARREARREKPKADLVC